MTAETGETALPPVMMVHGMWSTGADWDNWRGVFEAHGLRVHTPTLRHHDAAPDAPPPEELGTTSLRDYADDLAAEIGKLPEPPVLVGHAMGGLLVQMLLARGLGRGGILVTPAAPAGILALRASVLRAFWRIVIRWGFWARPQRLDPDVAAWALFNRMSPAEVGPAVLSRVHESGRAAFEIGFWPFSRHPAAAVDKTKLTQPLLVFGATDDRLAPAPVCKQVAKRYGGNAKYERIDGHAHWLLAEPGWERTATRAADWVRFTFAPGRNRDIV